MFPVFPISPISTRASFARGRKQTSILDDTAWYFFVLLVLFRTFWDFFGLLYFRSQKSCVLPLARLASFFDRLFHLR